MTTTNEEKKAITEQQYIGFRKKPANLETTLAKQECVPLTHKKNAGREPGSRYRLVDPKTFGIVYVLYQEGASINPDYSPSREEGNIAAVLQINITTGIIPGLSDQPLVDMRDTLVAYVLDMYRASAGAFVYFPQPAAKQETA
ncbi:hypothetical protein HZC31_06025 [Candidatus Woesearchaeota archaeon]|nr:hypothetical protein [Candidatus Woesearchaeota archaeon]